MWKCGSGAEISVTRWNTKFRPFPSLLYKVNGVSFARSKWSSVGLSRHGKNYLSRREGIISLWEANIRGLTWRCAAENWQGYVTRISMWYQKPCFGFANRFLFFWGDARESRVHETCHDLCMSHREHSLKLSVDPSSLWQCTQRLQFPRPSFRWLRSEERRVGKECSS